jgi:broad specificity phosphatase PhoE
VTRTTVHVVRHGEVYNPRKVLYGRLPGFRLSNAGVAMAEQAASFLSDRDLTHIVSSPLQRAQETAAPIAAKFGLQVQLDERLIEASNAFEGLPVGGSDSVLMRPSSWWLYRNPLQPSWGEPYRQVSLRMYAAVLRARDLARGHEAVCISHQLPIVCLRRYAEGQHLWHDPRKRQCSLASVTSLVFDGDRVLDVSYAEPAGSTSNVIGYQSGA